MLLFWDVDTECRTLMVYSFLFFFDNNEFIVEILEFYSHAIDESWILMFLIFLLYEN